MVIDNGRNAALRVGALHLLNRHLAVLVSTLDNKVFVRLLSWCGVHYEFGMDPFFE